MKPIQDLVIAIKGAGEMASAVAWRLYRANLRCVYMMEVPKPLAVRRRVSFCEAIHGGAQTIEGVTATAVDCPEHIPGVWAEGNVAVLVDPRWRALEAVPADVCVDAILAKHNLGTTQKDAITVIGIGPGFVAGKDVHLVVETNRGHHLGRVLTTGSASPNTGEPGPVCGHTEKRVLRAPTAGRLKTSVTIGSFVTQGQEIGRVGDSPVVARISGVVRGLIHEATELTPGVKIGDIDPRGDAGYCDTISDKARAIAGSVLESILGSHLSPAVPKESPQRRKGCLSSCEAELVGQDMQDTASVSLTNSSSPGTVKTFRV